MERWVARGWTSACARGPQGVRSFHPETRTMTTPVVPLLDLRLQYAPIRDEILTALTRVCDSQRFIMGPEVDGLERDLAAMLEVKHAIGVSSGTDALLVAMMALGISKGDEVVTSTYSFFALSSFAGWTWLWIVPGTAYSAQPHSSRVGE